MIPILSHLKLNLVTAIAAASLAACASGVTVSHENIARSYQPNELRAVGTGENELRTVIVGDPFDIPKDAFDEAVLASFQSSAFGPSLNFSTDPKHEDGRKRHVVLAFNLTKKSQADALCSGSADTAQVADTNGRLTVTGVYCSGNQYLTQATVRSDSVTGPDTEQFRRLMAQLAKNLFPAENPQNCYWARQVRLCS